LSTWIPHFVSQHRRLLVHSADASFSDKSLEDEDSDEESSKVEDSDEAGYVPKKPS
jgi:hypothetical protein